MPMKYKGKSSEIGLKCVFGSPLLNPEELNECFTSDLTINFFWRRMANNVPRLFGGKLYWWWIKI